MVFEIFWNHTPAIAREIFKTTSLTEHFAPCSKKLHHSFPAICRSVKTWPAWTGQQWKPGRISVEVQTRPSNILSWETAIVRFILIYPDTKGQRVCTWLSWILNQRQGCRIKNHHAFEFQNPLSRISRSSGLLISERDKKHRFFI